MTRTTPPERLNLAWFGVTQWCPVLGHTCDGIRGDCRCECHRNRTTLRAVPRRAT